MAIESPVAEESGKPYLPWFSHPDETIEEMVETVREFNPDADADLLRRAYHFARYYHRDQKRLTGDPYLVHLVATAKTLIDVQMDDTSIAVGLLHDVIEDTEATYDDVVEEFGKEIADMVEGVTKLRMAQFDNLDDDSDTPAKKRRQEFRKNAENLRKIFVAVAKDLRVMMVKLADRLHNMHTLDGVAPEKAFRVAQETLQIYAPLAHRLGVWKIKWHLEDLAFKYIEPEKYDQLVEMVSRTRRDRESDIQDAINRITKSLEKAGIDAEIHGRPKHLWSIYQKMLKEKVDFADIYDLIAIRIIVNTVPECYHVLGIVHDLWIPIAERFDDFIARAKANMYQSLHTKVIGPHGDPLEIQIRTWDMHRTAEFGIAAHWQYKEGGSGKNGFDRKMQWLRQQLFDWQADSKDATEFLRNVINDLFTDQVFVFTPKGDVIDLPAGSTPLDFAYRIHSDLGHHCVAAKVNGRIVPLSHKLANGAIIEVVTRNNSAPSLDWLNFVKTGHAKNKIKSYFRRLHFAESVTKGRELLEKECDRQGHDRVLLKSENLTRVVQSFNKQTEDDLLAAVGFGHVGPSAVINRLAPPEIEEPKLGTGRSVREGRVEVQGAEQMMVTRANCCLPVPGDDVIGFTTRGKGLMIHRKSCPNVANYRQTEPERLMEVDWDGDTGGKYQALVKIETLDRVGLLVDIASIFSEAKINIINAKAKALPNKRASFDLKVEVESLSHLNQVMSNVAKLNDVMNIYRVGGKQIRRRRGS